MRPRGLHVHFFLFSSYPTADLEATERQYERHKLSEGWVRGGKPMSAGIVWVRRLLAYVEAPMEQFGRWPALLSAPESKKIVRRYNRLAETLVQAELVWCRGWGASLDRLPAALAAPLLARSEGRLVVNLQSSTLLALQEVPQFRRLGLRSAWDPATLLKHRARLEGAYNRLRSVLQAGRGDCSCYYGHGGSGARELACRTRPSPNKNSIYWQDWEALHSRVPGQLVQLMAPCLEYGHAQIEKGLGLSWESTLLDGFLHAAEQVWREDRFIRFRNG